MNNIKYIIGILITLLTSVSNAITIDGLDSDWSKKVNSDTNFSMRVDSDKDYIYVGINNGRDLIPISVGDITTFIPIQKNKIDFYLEVTDKGLLSGDDNSLISRSNVKISLRNGKPIFQYLKPINSNYLSSVKYKISKNGNFIEIAIPKKLLETNPRFADKFNVYSVTEFPDGLAQKSANTSRMARRFNSRAILANKTLTVGFSVSGLGKSLAVGFAEDDHGLGLYVDITAGVSDFGVSLDAGLFNGDIPNLNGETTSLSVDGYTYGAKVESPVDDFTSITEPGSGIIVSMSIDTPNLGGSSKKTPTIHVTKGWAMYLITTKEVLQAFGFSSSDNSSTDNSSDNFNPNYGGEGDDADGNDDRDPHAEGTSENSDGCTGCDKPWGGRSAQLNSLVIAE